MVFKDPQDHQENQAHRDLLDIKAHVVIRVKTAQMVVMVP